MIAPQQRATGLDAITSERVEELRWNIIENYRAAEAASELLRAAAFHIALGRPAPAELRAVLCDGLEHLEFNDPLAAFGHIRPKPKAGRGRRRAESDSEWLQVMRDILRIHHEGFPLTAEGERWPFMQMSAAFVEYASRHVEGNEDAVKKEARRVQAGFWKHIRSLPAAQIDELGLSEYVSRKKS